MAARMSSPTTQVVTELLLLGRAKVKRLKLQTSAWLSWRNMGSADLSQVHHWMVESHQTAHDNKAADCCQLNTTLECKQLCKP